MVHGAETGAPNGLLMKETSLNNGPTEEVTNTELEETESEQRLTDQVTNTELEETESEQRTHR